MPLPIEPGLVLQNKKVAAAIFLITIQAPRVVQQAAAGQFVQLLLNEKNYDPLLRRPFCFHQIDKENGAFAILYQVVGKGTELLSQIAPQATISVLGPLGNGFKITPAMRNAILIGGGMGAAPLSELKKQLLTQNINYEFFTGAKSREMLYSELGPENVSTDDGSYGYQGFITDLVEKKIKEGKISETSCIFACGPIPMLKAVQKLALKYKLPGQMSLEAKMACGFGVCLGCAVKKAQGEGYYKVCKDGPVFNLDEVSLGE